MVTDRATLKSYFETGEVPTEQQFAQLIDAFMHRDEDAGQIQHVGHGEALVIGGNSQSVIWGDMNIAGALTNDGELQLRDGGMITFSGDGIFNNNGIVKFIA